MQLLTLLAQTFIDYLLCSKIHKMHRGHKGEQDVPSSSVEVYSPVEESGV